MLMDVNNHKQFTTTLSVGMCEVVGVCDMNMLVHIIYVRLFYHLQSCFFVVSLVACIWILCLVIKL